jgi:hypothetical protein
MRNKIIATIVAATFSFQLFGQETNAPATNVQDSAVLERASGSLKIV